MESRQSIGLAMILGGLVAFNQTSTMINSQSFNFSTEHFDKTGEVAGVWMPTHDGKWRLVYLLWISLIIYGVMHVVNLDCLPLLKFDSEEALSDSEESEEFLDDKTEDAFEIFDELIEQSPVVKDSPVFQQSTAKFDWIKPILTYPMVMVIGGQGSGKSTIVKWLIEQRINGGNEIVVLDPHAAFGDWSALRVVGKGLNWPELEEYLTEFCNEVTDRYIVRANNQNPSFKKLTIVCEEMTNWTDHISPKLIGEFDGKLGGDIRKVNIQVIKIAHNDTLTTTGGKTGTKGIQKHYIRLYLESKPDDSAPEAVSPKFEGLLYLPNRTAAQKVKINQEWKPKFLDSNTTTTTVDLGNLEPLVVD